MNDIAIKVSNISKRYRIGLQEKAHDTLGSAFASWVKSPIRNFRRVQKLSKFRNDIGDDIFWAVKDVSFEVKRGEVLGIIGKNGAGKSTLLKILARITDPTSGVAEINGRIGSLLEVGTGFHPELTGRENVYLNGTILGMTKREIENKFKEIVDFSGIEKFIDTPVKRYSSGMRVRLAFAVAAHLEPEILLIDEVLAVGDIEFQKKCIGKMGSIAGEGRTVIFVTHSMSALASLCPRTLLLDGGNLISEGPTEAIIQKYLSFNADQGVEGRGKKMYRDEVSEDGRFLMHAISTLDAGGEIRDEFKNTETIYVELEFSMLEQINNIVVGIELMKEHGEFAFRSFHNDIKEIITQEIEGKINYKLTATIPGGLLNGGGYSIYPCIGIHNVKWLVGGTLDIDGIAISISYNAPNPEMVYPIGKPGIVSPLLEWASEGY